jgi:hypothetical protein
VIPIIPHHRLAPFSARRSLLTILLISSLVLNSYSDAAHVTDSMHGQSDNLLHPESLAALESAAGEPFLSKPKQKARA